MLLKAYFALGFTAVAVVGSALPFPDNMESGLSMRSDTDLAFARESASELGKRLKFVDCHVPICKNKDYTDCFNVTLNAYTCYNLVSSDGRPFVASLEVVPSCPCTMYEKKECEIYDWPWKWYKTKSFKKKRVEFGFDANSVMCDFWG